MAKKKAAKKKAVRKTAKKKSKAKATKASKTAKTRSAGKKPVKRKVSSGKGGARKVLESPPPAPIEGLSKAELAQADRRYVEKIQKFRDQKKGVLESLLYLHWEYGEFAADMFNAPSKYGNRTAEHMAKDLEMHPDTIRSYHRFYQRYTREEVKAAVEKGLQWRVIQALLAVDDPKERAQLENKVVSKKITSDELRSEVKERGKAARAKAKASGRKVDRRGGLHGSAAIRNCISLADEMARKIDQYVSAVQDIEGIEDDKKAEEMMTLRNQGKHALNLLKERIDKALKV